MEDQEVLLLAREAAEKLMMADKSLSHLPSLRQELEVRYQKMIGQEILT